MPYCAGNNRNSHNTLLIVLLPVITVMLLSGCGASERRPSSSYREPVQGELVGSRIILAPVLRVGMTDMTSTIFTAKSPGGITLVDNEQKSVVRTGQVLHQVSFFVEGATGKGPQTRYRVQVASLSSKQAAEQFAAKLEKEFKLPAHVVYNSQTRTWRVQLGDAESRAAASEIESRLKQKGYAETWILSQAAPDSQSGTLVAVNAGGTPVARSTSFRIVPTSRTGLLEIGENRYRGAFEVRIDPEGKILPINIINMEQYLRGVVPAEMSGTVYPQLEALKAQALAARTYAYRNRGQYAAEGYDICNTPSCQVYNGVNAEQALTDQAVEETKGQIITYSGKPINALFTSTCGGHTEDVENIFTGSAEPYLRGTICEPEAGSFSHLSTGLEPQIVYGTDGLPLNYEIALLTSAGVLEHDYTVEPSKLVIGSELLEMLPLVIAGSGNDDIGKTGIAESTTPTVMQAIDALCSAAGFDDRIKRQVSDLDLKMLLDAEDSQRLPESSQRNLVYFLRLGFISTESDGSIPHDRALNQTCLVRMLSRFMEYEGKVRIVASRMVARNGNDMSVEIDRKVETFSLAEGVRLFKEFQNFVVPVRSLQIAPGDRVKLLIRGGKIRTLVHTPPLEGITSDRFSRYLNWDVRYTNSELEDRISKYSNVGTVTDLRPLKYGVSERIVELQVVGSKGTTTLTGLRIRWALGLRENLFIIERTFDDSGVQNGWRFIGRGWGHGVGLCQVGAYGMAMEGKSYKEILQHYYAGTDVSSIE